MERSGTSPSATNILPIPPAVEFPFPQTGNESFTEPSIDPAGLRKQPQSFPLSKETSSPNSKKPTTSPPRNFSDPPRPPPVRLLSERPVHGRRSLRRGMKKGQTTFGPTALTDAAGGSNSESDSANDVGFGLGSRGEHLSGRSIVNKRFDKAKTEGNSMSRRRASENRYSRFSIGNAKYKTKGKVSKLDGRLHISVNETANRGYLAHALGATIKHHLKKPDQHDDQAKAPQFEPVISPDEDKKHRRPDFNARVSALSAQPPLEAAATAASVPRLNIVIMVIGSRGDIQPFLKVGKLLKEDYGHRVRMATHPAFKDFVEQDSGLEFFSVGGDPAELMAFMVKNPGLVPSMSTVRAGEIGRRRDSMFEMFQGFWRACINATDDEHDVSNLKMMGDKPPFVADAIIANPPCFAHVHCAERLGVPLHLMFTFPYSPTQQFAHPLANIKNSNVDTNYTNFMSYPLVEMMTWQGLGDLVNRFRERTLGLEPVSTLWAPGQLYRLKVPHTYMWSPGLIPKPEDWGPEIDIAGFVFLDLASSFQPPDTLVNFLEAGETPIYIGFGSIVVDDPDKFSSLIFDAVKKAGVRALVSKGWGGLGDAGSLPDNIYMLENTPHDWLFPRVSAVVHHGGAGTTAIGLRCGRPTMIVPFFGDQPFWGAMVARAGAGAQEAVPYKRLTADILADGIKQCLSTKAKEAAQRIAEDIAKEGDGAKNAAESFHCHLPMQGERSMRCSILPDRVAVWTLKHSNLRVSALAAELLVREKKIEWQSLHLLRHYDWNDFEGPGEPFTGGGAAIMKSTSRVMKGVGALPLKWTRHIKGKNGQNRKNEQAARNSYESNDAPTPELQSNGRAENPENVEQDTCFESQNLPSVQSPLCSPHNNALKQQILSNGDGRVRASGNHAGADQGLAVDPSKCSRDNLAYDIAEDTGTGFAKSGKALVKAPMDLSLAVAQGFHNAPRLYGDNTVRTAPRIYGIKSGLRAAKTEFAFGVYDGVRGLFLHPYNGARNNGAIGFVQGVGKGIGGFVLKDLAAVISPFGYTMKGVHKEVVKSRQPTSVIRKARIIQGGEDFQALDNMMKEREISKAEAAWRIVSEIRKEDEAHKREGVKGRLAVLRGQRKVEKAGALEDVSHARKALESKQKGGKAREDMTIQKNSK